MQIMQYLSVILVSVLLVSCADTNTETVILSDTVEIPSHEPKSTAIATVEEANKTNQADPASLPETQAVDTEETHVPATHPPAATGNIDRASEPLAPVLPTGRLNGVFGTSDDFQAYVSTGNETLKLKAGDQWAGWVVDSIAPNKLIISAGAEKHTLSLSQSIAPEAGKQLIRQNKYTGLSLPDNDLSETSAQPFRITQAQRETLQKRLLSIH